MNTKSGETQAAVKNLGWLVTFAGTGSLLAVGVLFAWSVVSKNIPAEWGWTELDKSMPYSVACLVFSLLMVVGGRLQDRFGPRLVVTAGGIFAGVGMIIASQSTSPLGYIIGYGLLLGTGIGFVYSSAVPAAVKWFPAQKTGLIAGIVLVGFGSASIYIAPLTNSLINSIGVPRTILALGISMLVVVLLLAQLIKAPPAGYIPPGSVPAAPGAAEKRVDFTPKEVVGTWQFYSMWVMFASGAGAGLMIISKLATLVELQTGLTLGFLLVSTLAVGNGAGRVIAGSLSDKYGRKITLFGTFLFQAVLIILLSLASGDNVLGSTAVMVALSVLIGANYGALMAVFPAISKDYYGLKNFGANYGLIYTAWGLGGFMLSLMAGRVFDATNSFNFAYNLSAVLLVVAAVLTLLLKTPKPKEIGSPAGDTLIPVPVAKERTAPSQVDGA